MAKRFYGSYESKKNRSSIERADAGMIPSGSGNFANMPDKVVMREFPKVGAVVPSDMSDGIGRVDKQIRQDSDKAKSQVQKEGK